MSILVSSFYILSKVNRLKVCTYVYLYYDPLEDRFIYRNRMLKSIAKGRCEFASDLLGVIQTCFLTDVVEEGKVFHVTVHEEINTPYKLTNGILSEFGSIQELKQFEDNIYLSAKEQLKHVCVPLNEQNKLLKDIIVQLAEIKVNQEAINNKLFTLNNKVNYLEKNILQARRISIIKNNLITRFRLPRVRHTVSRQPTSTHVSL